MTNKISKAIKEKRESLKLTQLEVANKAKISRSYLNDIENERCTPSLKVLDKLSEVLNIEVKIMDK